MPTRQQIAKPDIIKYFNLLPKQIFDKSDIARILQEQRSFWRLAKSTTTADFIRFLSKSTRLKTLRFAFPYRSITRFTWGVLPLYDVLLSLRPESYLTHYTAMYFHELTDQVPKTININVEQPPKRCYAVGSLSQERIDIAFKSPTRMSSNVTEYGDFKIRMLNGLHTGNLGVIEMPGPEGETLRITDVERTLIDIAVRPEYSGGVFEVLEAYRRASTKVSINRLAAHLKMISYTYPFHQVIGFYLTMAGSYKKVQIDLLRRFEMSYDFYLTHQIGEKEYSREWRLFYPKGLG